MINKSSVRRVRIKQAEFKTIPLPMLPYKFTLGTMEHRFDISSKSYFFVFFYFFVEILKTLKHSI